MQHDPVNRPSHYTDGKIEVIDFIEDKKLNFHLGNAVKYIARAGKKDNLIQDLQKAAWYLNREIERLHSEEVVRRDNDMQQQTTDLPIIVESIQESDGTWFCKSSNGYETIRRVWSSLEEAKKEMIKLLQGCPTNIIKWQIQESYNSPSAKDANDPLCRQPYESPEDASRRVRVKVS